MIELRDWQKAAFVKAIDWFEADGPANIFSLMRHQGLGKQFAHQ